MDIRPIKTEDDYDAALADIDRWMGSPADSRDGDRLEVLVTLVEAYEAVHWPIDAPIPSRQSCMSWRPTAGSRRTLRN